MRNKQRGTTLLEVLLAVVVVAVGIVASVAIELKALQMTDSARREGGEAFARYSQHERGQP